MDRLELLAEAYAEAPKCVSVLFDEGDGATFHTMDLAEDEHPVAALATWDGDTPDYVVVVSGRSKATHIDRPDPQPKDAHFVAVMSRDEQLMVALVQGEAPIRSRAMPGGELAVAMRQVLGR